jgi:hypothetical protein
VPLPIVGVTGIGRLAVTLEKATDKSSSSNDHHSRRTSVRFKFDTPCWFRVAISATERAPTGLRKAPQKLYTKLHKKLRKPVRIRCGPATVIGLGMS